MQALNPKEDIIKFGRNELCWCGSGLKYKSCHISTEKERTVPQGQMTDHIRKQFSRNMCLYPEGHEQVCSKKIIKAHSIQKAKAFTPIVNSENKVYTFYQSQREGEKLVGWNQASTFKGFCSKHDKSLFQEIEDNDLAYNHKHLFILGYRGFCHELYQKMASLRSKPYMFENLIKGKTIEQQQQIYWHLNASEEGNKKGLREIENIKKNKLDPAFLAKDYHKFSGVFIEFSGKQCIAASGVITPDFNVSGEPLQKLYDHASIAHHMSFSLINEGEKIILSLFWPSDFTNSEAFTKSLLNLDGDELIKKVFAVAFGYLENVYFSESWWAMLSTTQKQEISMLAYSVFYTIGSPELSFLPVTWSVVKVHKIGVQQSNQGDALHSAVLV